MNEKTMDAQERDVARAEYIRGALKSPDAGDKG
jgi:hypothetical protein